LVVSGILLILSILMPASAADDIATAYLGEVERRIMAVWKFPPKSDGLKVT
jgi:hypothetical protein